VPVVCVARGDVVQVVTDVIVKGENCKGMVGEVVEDLSEEDPEEWGACCDLAWGQPPLKVQLRATVKGYFAEGELTRLSGSRGWDLVEGDRVRVTADVQVWQ